MALRFDALDGTASVPRFACARDVEHCRRIHRRYGTTYYFATRAFPREIRRRTHAIYAFVRTPDEWVDNPTPDTDAAKLLARYRDDLLRAFDGASPGFPELRAFCDVVKETGMPIDEPLLFLQSMEQDLWISQYPSYQDLRSYMRGSAASVGIMMCYALGAMPSEAVLESACALGEAMQLTNFLRDIAEDAKRGRTYLPLEDLNAFGLSPKSLTSVTPKFVGLMRFEVERARALYRQAEPGISLLPRQTQPAVRLAAALYERILDRIEHAGYDVFSRRVRTPLFEKLVVAAGILRQQIIR